MGEPAISVHDVSKRFRLEHERYNTLKERVLHLGRVPHEEFWALRNIEIDVDHGETVGIIGHNGSGKSTLLKCVAGILRPTQGVITTRGRVAALLELGAGFQSELTGRENIFLNGAILGMSRREIARRFDTIVEFSELEQFIDTQVRFYSSGMYVRLGFAIAVNVEPDILLIDEVLSVGDEAFQKKCIERVREFQRDGTTILFVTHAVDMARQICDRVAVLDHGHLVALDEPAAAIRSFRDHLLHKRSEEELEREERGGADDADSPLTVVDVQFVHPGQPDRAALLPGEPLEVRIDYDTTEPIDDVEFMLFVYDLEGQLLHATSTVDEDAPPRSVDGPGTARFSFDAVPLNDGDYLVTVGATTRDVTKIHVWQEQRHRFQVMDPENGQGLLALRGRAEVIASGRPAATRR